MKTDVQSNYIMVKKNKKHSRAAPFVSKDNAL